MPKHFDPVNYGKQSCHNVTIYGNVITLSGTSGTVNVTINAFLNTAIASFSSDLATTAIAWVAANYDYYYARGIVVASTGSTGATGLITATPRYGYTSINSINASISAAVTGNLTGTMTGKCEIDFAKGRNWRVTFGQNITMLPPKNAKDGQAIRLELKATGAFSVTWTAGAWYFPGGTEPTQTSTATDVQSGVFQLAFARRYDTLTLSGSTTDGHSGTITMPGSGVAAATVTVSGSSLTTTASAFKTANEAAYLEKGVVLTSSGATLIFTASSNASDYFGQPAFVNVSGTLAGANVQTPEGRVLMNSPTATQQIIQ